MNFMRVKCANKLETGNYGKIVAIDIETGAFEVADEILTATDRLFDTNSPMLNPGLSVLDIVLRASLWRTKLEKPCMMHGVVNASCGSGV